MAGGVGLVVVVAVAGNGGLVMGGLVGLAPQQEFLRGLGALSHSSIMYYIRSRKIRRVLESNVPGYGESLSLERGYLYSSHVTRPVIST